MKISIDKSSKVPVYLQITDQIKAQIISGALPRSSALPSERALAQILDVHRNTVVKAYGVETVSASSTGVREGYLMDRVLGR